MDPRQAAKTTLRFTLSFLLLLSIAAGSSGASAAQAAPNKRNQPTNSVLQASTTPPAPKKTSTGSPGPDTPNQKDATTSVPRPQSTVEQGMGEFRWVFGLMTSALVLIAGLLTFALVNISRKKMWSLSDALSEESSVQPSAAEIRGKANVILFASTSRLIALVGLLAAVPTVIGVGYAIAWNLIVNGYCPDLGGVRALLIGISLTFAPYLANQVRSIFDSRVSPAPSVLGPSPQPPPAVPVQGSPVPSGPLPQPTPAPAPTAAQISAAGLVEVRGSRREGVRPIAAVHELVPYLHLLRSHGLRTTNQVVGTAHATERAVAHLLNIRPLELQSLLKKIPHSADLAAARTRPQPKFPMGARIDLIPRISNNLTASGLAAANLPSSVNLISQMPAVRDQGRVRLTCVAFAALGVFEHYLKLQSNYVGLSEEFLYWDCKQTDGKPNEPGTFLAWAMPLLIRDGCCTDDTWQYNASEIPGNEGEGPPPSQATTEAASFTVTSYHDLLKNPAMPNVIDGIKSELARGQCVAFTIPIFQSSFNNPEVIQTGEFINPFSLSTGDVQVGGHSMCFVGYQDDEDNDPALGGGTLYLRNSWDQWATESVLGTAGYGTISYSYITSWCAEAYSIN
jgi:hypothetical protein